MQARIDEHTCYSHLKMSFIEFIEAIARACEYLSLGPPSDHIREAYKEFLFQFDRKEAPNSSKIELSKIIDPEEIKDEDDEFLENEEGAFLSRDEHINQSLHNKIENLIPYLLAY